MLCLEEEEAPCYYLNNTLWNDHDKLIQNPLDALETSTTSSSLKPIIKSCPEELIESHQCQTDRCDRDEDCFSGRCVAQSCATDQAVYICSGTEADEINNPIQCGKYHHMKCNKEEECTEPFTCREGYCESWQYKSSYRRLNWKSILGWGCLGLMVVVVLATIPIVYMVRKKKKTVGEVEEGK